MKTAYLTFSHPAVSQTFVVDEIHGLRELGFEVETWGIRPAAPAALQTRRFRAEAEATRTLRPVPWGATLRAHIRAFRAAPVGYLWTLARAVADRPPGARALGLALASFASGLRMWDELDRRGTRHLHVHFAGSPTHVATLVVRFGNYARRSGPPWTWSVSVHGPVEFADLTALRLRQRVRAALFVVAISDYARSQLLSLLPPELWDKVRVVRCGIDSARFEPASAAQNGEELRILYVGRLVALKGQPILLQALAALGRRGVKARLTLVGEGRERAALERLAQRLGVSDRVTFAGALDHDRVREEHRRADVFCLPSFAEGVPVVLMEAMAAGVPVVTTRVAGIPELVQDGTEGLLVRPGRADDLEHALARLAADPELRRRMGESGRAKVERDHDIRSSARELAALHREFRLGLSARVRITGCPVDPLDMAQTVARCQELITSPGVAQHVAVNAAKVIAMRDDPELRAIVEECELVSADGQSLVWVSRLLGRPLPARVAGIDLMMELLGLAEREGHSVYFLGARREVLERALENVRARHPRIRIAGARDGYFDDGDEAEVAEQIRLAAPDILFVAMSSPKKEYWLARHGRHAGVPFVMGVGGAVDVLGGHTRRAPEVLQRAGLEWAYRTAQEPRRMFPRYLATNTRFAFLVLRHLVRQGARGRDREVQTLR